MTGEFHIEQVLNVRGNWLCGDADQVISDLALVGDVVAAVLETLHSQVANPALILGREEVSIRELEDVWVVSVTAPMMEEPDAR